MPRSQVEILRAACCIAGIDGTIDPAERTLLERLAQDAGVGAVSLQAMINRAKSDPDFFEEQFRILRAEPEDAMLKLCAIAVADGDLSLNERVLLQHFGERLGISAEAFAKHLDRAERYVTKRQAGRESPQP